MRACRVSRRMRRFPSKSIRSTNGCPSFCWAPSAGANREKSSTFSSSVFSSINAWNREKDFRESPSSRGFSAELDAELREKSANGASRSAAKTQRRSARPASIPVKKQTILKAAVELLKAAPPNPRCYSPATPGMGWLRAERTTGPASRPHLRSYVASDSLVDDWGCLNNRSER